MTWIKTMCTHCLGAGKILITRPCPKGSSLDVLDKADCPRCNGKGFTMVEGETT